MGAAWALDLGTGKDQTRMPPSTESVPGVSASAVDLDDGRVRLGVVRGRDRLERAAIGADVERARERVGQGRGPQLEPQLARTTRARASRRGCSRGRRRRGRMPPLAQLDEPDGDALEADVADDGGRLGGGRERGSLSAAAGAAAPVGVRRTRRVVPSGTTR